MKIMQKTSFYGGLLGVFVAGFWLLQSAVVAKDVLPAEQAALWQDGDLIFQTSLSSQSKAIQLATHSAYSHCGLLFQQKGKWYVLEAVQPVKLTPIAAWIKRGKNGHYVQKRLKNAEKVLDSAVLQKMKAVGQSFLGKKYDLTFEWSDDKIYCSELIWKVYQRGAGIEIGTLQHLRDFDLTHPSVQQKMRERYGAIFPLEEPVISPAALFDSELLETISNH